MDNRAILRRREVIDMVDSIASVLVQRDGMDPEEARELVEEARQDLMTRIDAGESPFDLCEEWFGLEPDYLDELLY